MSNRPNDTGTGGDARFDRALREHHATAVERLSPRVRAQLAQRRNAALRGESAGRRHGFRYAAASFAAICALAIGLQFGLMPGPTNPTTNTSIAAASAPAGSDATMLDEDPEFYAWLASADAQQIAME
ncbi:MAG TPA: hypothetical protein VLC71_06650 [Thermomonas sp.]|nr:hypothetical protein [Thermomonas sp.]